ncbi:MAG: DNA polymerase Y family protein [Pseudomonadales bacterium]
MLWLGVHYPALGLEIFDTASSDPGVLVDQGVVVLCNPSAQRYGIVNGSSLATAHTIAPQLSHVQRNPTREAQCLQQLAEALYQLSPQVALVPPATLIIEISSSLRLFGNAHVMAEQATTLSAELGHEAVARLATTPSAATVLAQTHHTRLEAVPLSALDIEPQSIERFANMGFRRVGDVTKLPAKEIGQRFGKQVVMQLQQLNGQRSDPRVFIKLSPKFDQTQQLLDPMRNKQGLQFPMQRLAQQLKNWLIVRQLATSQLHWTFSSANTSATMSAEFSQPHQDPQKMLQISQLRLDQTNLPEDVIQLSLRAERLTPLARSATDLFDQHRHRTTGAPPRSTPDELLDTLKARLGSNACRRLEDGPFHHPTWLARQPVSNGFKPKTGKAAGVDETPRKQQRPLWLCRPPKSVRLTELTLLHGPERIHTAWWHKNLYRDYYIAEHREHNHCWAFTDQSERWFIHGYFG